MHFCLKRIGRAVACQKGQCIVEPIFETESGRHISATDLVDDVGPALLSFLDRVIDAYQQRISNAKRTLQYYQVPQEEIQAIIRSYETYTHEHDDELVAGSPGNTA